MDAPRRNYKDDNHKPEMHVALTEFWMLHGFRPLREILGILEDVPEFSPLHEFARETAAAGSSEGEVLRALYNRIMTSPQMETDRMLVPLIQRLERVSPSDRSDPDFWSLRAARTFAHPGPGVDRGILSIYLMNIVHLRPGEGTYQPAGTLHAYLEGTTVELMANSDNVIRGGLTTKHLDPEELLRVVEFRGEHPQILGGKVKPQGESAYPTPAQEFELRRVSLASGGEWIADTGGSAEIWLVIEGEGRARLAGDLSLELQAGNTVFVRPGSAVTTRAGQAGLLLFRAFVPPRDPAPL
jgi:mannose-6-phosphate isomerase